jgi:hypothetical protein
VNEIEITDYELHRRIVEEERHRREHRLWMVALAAAVFAGLSAVAAWMPILCTRQILCVFQSGRMGFGQKPSRSDVTANSLA